MTPKGMRKRGTWFGHSLDMVSRLRGRLRVHGLGMDDRADTVLAWSQDCMGTVSDCITNGWGDAGNKTITI